MTFDFDNITQTLATLARKLDLGDLLEDPSPVVGGALHTMWRVKTTQGNYVVKKINPHIAEKPSFPGNYEISEHIADMFREHDIPAVAAINYNGHYLHEIDVTWFIVYPYVKGCLLNLGEITVDHGKIVGELFAKIHNCALSSFDDLEVHYDVFDNQHWTNLIKESKHDSLNASLPQILKWNDQYHLAIPELDKNLLVTHRDMHHKNILWGKHLNPHVVDWESAGLINPILEIIGYSCEWSGIIWGQFNRNTFLALINSYLDARKPYPATSLRTAFYGWIGLCILGWTEFNIRRLLGMVASEQNEINIGRTIIDTRMSKCLRYLQDHEAQMIELIEHAWR